MIDYSLYTDITSNSKGSRNASKALNILITEIPKTHTLIEFKICSSDINWVIIIIIYGIKKEPKCQKL